tara:strand:- start:175 stop:456 length:282 start_codon:yes stop_codon:yes gene_type:complete
MAYELGSFFGLNSDPLVIIACLLIVKFENVYLRVVLYAIAYAVIMRSIFFFGLDIYDNFIERDFIYKMIGAILYASIFFSIKKYRLNKAKDSE